MIERNMSPFLKWAGGKTQILEQIIQRMPEEYNNYYEPFIGGGAVLLGIQPQKAVINDINPQLINLYTQIKFDSDAVMTKVAHMDEIQCNKEKYYEIRDAYNKKIMNNELDAECAAYLIWINKHCFNGLYRVNSKGLFNVPYNNKINGRSFAENNIIAISDFLRSADIKITCGDFEVACKDVKKDDFVYFDSPYVPQSETASFTDYAIDGFTISDHERLAELFKKLDKLGAKLMLSNNDVPIVRGMYSEYNIQTIDVKRMINSNANRRTGKEVIITNY